MSDEIRMVGGKWDGQTAVRAELSEDGTVWRLDTKRRKMHQYRIVSDGGVETLRYEGRVDKQAAESVMHPPKGIPALR